MKTMTAPPKPSRSAGVKKAGKHSAETMGDVLDRVVGKTVLVADPESLLEAPMGWQIGSAVFSAKLLGRTADGFALARKLVHGSGKKRVEEVVKQIVPLTRLKGITVMKRRVVLHV